jgi:hypothetical protein
LKSSAFPLLVSSISSIIHTPSFIKFQALLVSSPQYIIPTENSSSRLGSDLLVVSVLVFICVGAVRGVKRAVGCKRVHTRVEGTWVGKSYMEEERDSNRGKS